MAIMNGDYEWLFSHEWLFVEGEARDMNGFLGRLLNGFLQLIKIQFHPIHE
jgi:hypothetical protein